MQIPPRVDPLLYYIRAAAAAAGREKVSLNWLKIAKQVANGQAVIATRGFCKCQNPYGKTMFIKLSQILGPMKNLSKSFLILISPKTNLKFPFLISKSSPIISILQCCRAIGACYWTKIAKKMKKYKKRKRRKIPKIWHFFKKRT